MDFERLGLCDELIKAISLEGWERPTDCQEEAIPLILGGGDVLLAAPTGSGKTAAFGLPVLQIVWEMLQLEAPKVYVNESVYMDYTDCDKGIQLSGDCLKVVSDIGKWNGCRANCGVSQTGKYYYECAISCKEAGICRLGWNTKKDNLLAGCSPTSYGFGGSGKKSSNNVFETYGEIFTTGDTMGCCIDLDQGTISYLKNGKNLGIAFTNVDSSLKYYPVVTIRDGSASFNFGARPFAFCPEGYAPIPYEGIQHTVEQKKRSLLALILEPTRELAQQTYDCLMQYRSFMSDPSLSIGLLVGGASSKYMDVGKILENSHIIVATPNRFVDAMVRYNVQFNNLLFFILDEADQLVEDSNNLIMQIFNRIPARNNENNEYRLQVCMFSATLHSQEIMKASETFCQNPIWVDLKGKDYVPDRVQQSVFYVDVTSKEQGFCYDVSLYGKYTDGVYLSSVLHEPLAIAEEISAATKRAKLQIVKRLIDKYRMSRVMIFCRTNQDCDNLEKFFIQEGNGHKLDPQHPNMGGFYSCVVLAGLRDSYSRDFALDAFQNGTARILICTDVAARGIDVKELPFVINMTLPTSVEQYMHRIGRVGRANAIGLSISIVSKNQEKVWFHTCGKKRTNIGTCNNRKLTSEGGCCIWLDEMAMMGEIEERIGTTVPQLNLLLDLPPEIDLTGTRKSKNDSLIENASKNAETIKHNVEVLEKLQNQTQFSYLSLKSQVLLVVSLKNNANEFFFNIPLCTCYKRIFTLCINFSWFQLVNEKMRILTGSSL